LRCFWDGGEVWGGSAGPQMLVLRVLRAAVIVACGRAFCWSVVVGRLCQPVAGASVLSFWNAARSSVAHGHVCCRWSLPRRPENASLAAT
jgi:hypothetical protein